MATPADLKEVLPGWDDVPDETVQFWLDQAARVVDETWGVDQDRGQILLAAHEMTLVGLGPQASGSSGSIGVSDITSVRSGSLSLTLRDAKSGTAAAFASTSYGKLFYPMLLGYRGGMRVTGTGTIPGYSATRYPHGEA